MGVILADIDREDVDMFVNWATWGRTLEVLREIEIFDDERFKRMSYNGGGITVTAEEAIRIADYLELQVRTIEQRDPMNRRGLNEWFQELAKFCRDSHGSSIG